ncbi:hypothetical protein CYG68_14460 [Morganella morganii]|uniref:Uncharacterized protein n=1 Tax=Morganella morganii TaxID=582 RepID=A0A8I0PYD9_MORMO|nr:hypothetical protein [Morganella morganii]
MSQCDNGNKHRRHQNKKSHKTHSLTEYRISVPEPGHRISIPYGKYISKIIMLQKIIKNRRHRVPAAATAEISKMMQST